MRRRIQRKIKESKKLIIPTAESKIAYLRLMKIPNKNGENAWNSCEKTSEYPEDKKINSASEKFDGELSFCWLSIEIYELKKIFTCVQSIQIIIFFLLIFDI